MKVNFLYKPDEGLAEKLKEITKDTFLTNAEKVLESAAEHQQVSAEMTVQCQTYTRQLLEKARQLDCESDFYDVLQLVEDRNPDTRLFPYPKPLYHEASNCKLPLSLLPPVLKDYIQAASEYGQVPPEMCILPLLSVLSLCLIGKAKVKHHNIDFDNELTLYTITVAPSSARKSPALNHFDKPLYEYQTMYNEQHELERTQRATERQFYENKRKSALTGKNADLNAAQRYDEQLLELPPIPSLSLTVTDVTPESLGVAMAEHGGKMGILDSEGGVLRTISGLYTGGQSNIDLFLKSYDGEPCEIWRVGRGNITIQRPLLSIGLLTQPKRFKEFISNGDFDGNGFLNRFLFAFPNAPERYKDTAPAIPEPVQAAYNDLIFRLLSLPESNKAIEHDRESKLIFHDLHEYLQDSKQSGGIFEFLPQYAEKQLSNALKIAAILHLCTSSADTPITGAEANAAVSLAMWLYNQALMAFDGDIQESPQVQLAFKIADKMKKGKNMPWTIRDVYRETHSSADDTLEAIQMMIDCYWLRDNGKNPAERGYTVILNPLLR